MLTALSYLRESEAKSIWDWSNWPDLARTISFIGDIPVRTQGTPVWQALSAVRQNKVVAVPVIWMFGGLPSAKRFARTLVSALDAHHG